MSWYLIQNRDFTFTYLLLYGALCPTWEGKEAKSSGGSKTLCLDIGRGRRDSEREKLLYAWTKHHGTELMNSHCKRMFHYFHKSNVHLMLNHSIEAIIKQVMPQWKYVIKRTDYCVFSEEWRTYLCTCVSSCTLIFWNACCRCNCPMSVS